MTRRMTSLTPQFVRLTTGAGGLNCAVSGSATVWPASPCSDSHTSPPLAVPGGVTRGSDIMRKSLERVYDRLRTVISGRRG